MVHTIVLSNRSRCRMEAIPFFQALTRNQLPLAGYVGQLRALAVIHGALEHELAQLPADGAGSLLADLPSRLVHLRRDLTGFEPIVSAVCDEAAGIPRAVDSLRPWLCEPERFSPAWIAALAVTLEQARKGVASRHGAGK